MAKSAAKQPLSNRDVLGLAGFMALCFVVSGIGAVVTAGSVTGWYQTIERPSFNPPDWVFGPVWTALFIMMAIAAWRVWREAGFGGSGWALSAFGLQLALNLLWSVLFFGMHRIDLALIDIVVLVAAIGLTVWLFWRIDPLAGKLMIPYLLWVAFATALNASIWMLN